MSFVERHGLWSNEQKEAARRLRKIVEEQKLEVIRLSFPDQHGILRGKTLVASEALRSLESGCTITTTMLAKDTSHKTVFPVFTAGGGFGMRVPSGFGADMSLTWEIGEQVKHGKWGIGDIIKTENEGDNLELYIRFPAPVGERKLLAKFAPITKV